MNIIDCLLPCKICGAIPLSKTKSEGYECPNCKELNSYGCWGGGLDFRVKGWNTLQNKDNKVPSILNINGEDWYWGELVIELYHMGFSESFEKTFILFKTSRPYDDWYINTKTGWTNIIDNGRHCQDLTLMDIKGEIYEIPWLNMPKSSKKAYAYLDCCQCMRSKNNYPRINIHTISHKYVWLAKEMILKIEPGYDFYNHRSDRRY